MTNDFNKILKVFIAIPPGSGSTMIFNAIKNTPGFTCPSSICGNDESSKIAAMIDQDCLPEPDLYDVTHRNKYNSKKKFNLERAGRLFGLYLEELNNEPRNFIKYLDILEKQTNFSNDCYFVEKSPSSPIWAIELSNYLRSANSNYKFILGLRNPISFIDRTLRSIEINFPQLSKKELIQMCIKNWINIAELQLKNEEVIKDNALFFTYEEVLNNTQNIQDKLSNFLGMKIIINNVIRDNNNKTYKSLAGNEIIYKQLENLLDEKKYLLKKNDYYDLLDNFVNKR